MSMKKPLCFPIPPQGDGRVVEQVHCVFPSNFAIIIQIHTSNRQIDEV
jgi:hypothetical protein